MSKKEGKMNFWMISDTHFGHNNIIKYCSRPKEHEAIMMQNISKVNSGVIFHLGDFGFRNLRYWHELFFDSIQSGVKTWLIRGNHDKKSIPWYLSQGWDFVADAVSMTIEGVSYLFTHRPEFAFEEDYNIHGHLHIGEHRLCEISDYNVLVSMEKNNYKPVLLSNLMAKRRKRN